VLRNHPTEHALVLDQFVQSAGTHGRAQTELELLVEEVHRLGLLRERSHYVGHTVSRVHSPKKEMPGRTGFSPSRAHCRPQIERILARASPCAKGNVATQSVVRIGCTITLPLSITYQPARPAATERPLLL